MVFFHVLSQFLFAFVYFGEALEFDTAFEKGEFEAIEGSKLYFLDPDKFPAKSLYYDISRSNSAQNNEQSSIELTFKTDNIQDPDFMVGISLVFLKLTTSRDVDVKVSMDNAFSKNTVVQGNFGLPNGSIDETHIIRSWQGFDFSPIEDFNQLELKVTLADWKISNQVYMTVTSYRIKRSGSDLTECQGFSFKRPKWWNCNTNEEEGGLVCLNYELTCDGLPHCAKQAIPNPDENCGYHVGFREALQLLVYSLLTIFIVLFVAGCAKCCLRGACQARQRGRRPSDVLEILSAETSQRPDNSPPTYEDAMKYVNEAFEESESEGEQEPPPTYSPVPKEGEFVFTNSPMSEDGAVGGSTGPSGTPQTCCSCDKPSIVRPRPRSRSPRPQQQPGTTFLNISLPPQNSFNNDLDNQAVASLPKDPPPYIEHAKED